MTESAPVQPPPTRTTPGAASKVQQVKAFFATELWLADVAVMSAPRRWYYQALKVGASTVSGFMTYQCSLQASALTYITLMSMVPVLALMFSVAKGLGAHDLIQGLVLDKVKDLPPQVSEALQRVFAYVENTNLRTLGILGVLLLFVTVISVMGKIETSFNTIWQVATPRTMVRRFTDYLCILMLAPVLLLVATSVNAVLSAPSTKERLQLYMGPLFHLYEVGLGLGLVMVVVAAFFFLYLLMPNTRVKWGAALAGGACAGVSWALLQWVYIRFQIGVANANAIYGTFAVVPLFLAWLYASWTIVLSGALIGQAVQHLEMLHLPGAFQDISLMVRQRLGLILVNRICAAFRNGQVAPTARQLSAALHLPLSLVSETLAVVVGAGVIVEIAGKASGYVPARDLERLTLADVEHAFRTVAGPGVPFIQLPSALPFDLAFQSRYEPFVCQLECATFRELTNPEANS